MRTGGVILCGGKSKRMGLSKVTLPFGDEMMLPRMVRLLGPLVQPLVVVAAAGQELPPLPDDVILTHDRRSERGPLEGLCVGLLALQGRADAAYATSCDVPLLQADFVRRMIALLDQHDVAVPVEGKFHHPLAAVYRTSVTQHIETLLDAEQLRPLFLYQRVDTLRVSVEELREVDPHLDTLANLNRPEDYLAALERSGFEAPKEIVAAMDKATTGDR